MSYALIVAEVRRGQFEERNLDSIGLCSLLAKEAVLLAPAGRYAVSERSVDTMVRVSRGRDPLPQPPQHGPHHRKGIRDPRQARRHSLHLVLLRQRARRLHGRPFQPAHHHRRERLRQGAVPFLQELLCGQDLRRVPAGRGGTLRGHRAERQLQGARPRETCGRGRWRPWSDMHSAEGGGFIGYVEEEKGEIDITKADFLLSVGRGIGSKDEIPAYEDLADTFAGPRHIRLEARHRQAMAPQGAPGGHLGQDRQAEGLPCDGHKRGFPAYRGHEGLPSASSP